MPDEPQQPTTAEELLSELSAETRRRGILQSVLIAVTMLAGILYYVLIGDSRSVRQWELWMLFASAMFIPIGIALLGSFIGSAKERTTLDAISKLPPDEALAALDGRLQKSVSTMQALRHGYKRMWEILHDLPESEIENLPEKLAGRLLRPLRTADQVQVLNKDGVQRALGLCRLAEQKGGPEHLVGLRHWTKLRGNHEHVVLVREAALRALAHVETRVEEERPQRTLLRAADAPETVLLRPAGFAPAEDESVLLRPSSPDN